MIIAIEPRQSDLSHLSSTVMWVLVIFAVLLLFGVGTFVRLAYGRWPEEASSTEDTRTHSPHSPVFRKSKVSFPAAGVNRIHANASQSPSPPHVSSTSKGELAR